MAGIRPPATTEQELQYVFRWLEKKHPEILGQDGELKKLSASETMKRLKALLSEKEWGRMLGAVRYARKRGAMKSISIPLKAHLQLEKIQGETSESFDAIVLKGLGKLDIEQLRSHQPKTGWKPVPIPQESDIPYILRWFSNCKPEVVAGSECSTLACAEELIAGLDEAEHRRLSSAVRKARSTAGMCNVAVSAGVLDRLRAVREKTGHAYGDIVSYALSVH